MRTRAYTLVLLMFAALTTTAAAPTTATAQQQNPYPSQQRGPYGPQQQAGPQYPATAQRQPVGQAQYQQTGGPQQQQQQTGYQQPAGVLQQQPGNPRAGQQGSPRYVDAGPYQPQQRESQPPFQISPEHQKYLDELLAYWEHRSNQISTFKCSFTRWEYKPAFLADPNKAWTISEGVVQYAQPDKGLFRIDKIGRYTPPAKNPDGTIVPGARETYANQGGVFGEYWICDGESVFEYNYAQKQLIERELPADMRGQAIADGPLPFLFGAKADRLKSRFWMRVITPPDVQKEYWIDARPKTRQDAANYERIEVILDQTDFLPKAMQIYLPGGTERTSFQFASRTVNSPWELFKRDFSKPALPRGWTKVTERPPASIPPQQPLPPANGAEQALRPGFAPPR